MKNEYLKSTIILSLMLIFFGCSPKPTIQENQRVTTSYYELKNDDSSVIVFVHGILGNSLNTWRNEDSNTSWQTLIKNDEKFKKFSIYNVNYPTELFGNSLNINELGTYLQDTLEAANIFEYRNVHIICHSLGGLVTKDMLLKLNKKNQLNHIKSIAFLGVPSRGVSLTKLASVFPQAFLSKNLKDLAPLEDNTYLDSLNDRWKPFVKNTNIKLNSWYEAQTIKGIKIVTKSEADAAYDTISPLNKNHISIAKPLNRKDENYEKVMHIIQGDRYNTNKVTKIFNLPDINIKDTNKTNEKIIKTQQHIELINYSQENIFIDRVDLSSGICYKQNTSNTQHIWIRENQDINKILRIDEKTISSSNVKLKLEPNEHLNIDITFTRKVIVTDKQLNIIKNMPLPRYLNPSLFTTSKLMELIDNQLGSHTLNIGSTTDYMDCISLGRI